MALSGGIMASGLHYQAGLLVDYSQGALSPAIDDPARFVLGSAQRTFATTQAYFQYLHPITDDFQVRYGGAISSMLDYMVYNHPGNNPVGYELTFSLAPMAGISYEITEKLGFSAQVSIPVVSMGLRTPWQGFFPTQDLELSVDEILATHATGGPGQIFFLDTRAQLSYQVPKSPTLALTYRYRGHSNHTYEQRGSILHALSFTTTLSRHTSS